MSLTYVPPTITVASTGAQAPQKTGPATKTIMVIGNAPIGPDFPTVIGASQASLFGDATAASSIGFSIPYLLDFALKQRQPNAAAPFQFLVCRAGVARGTKAVPDVSAGTCFTLSAVGKYAGSASQFLKVALTVVSSRISTISFVDSRTNVTLQTFTDINTAGGLYDLGTNAKAVAAINGANPLSNSNSIVQATVGASALVPVAFASVAFSTGTDGIGTLFNDTTIAATGGLLDQSLQFSVDYIVAGFDGSSIAPALLTHTTAALNQLQFRRAVLGPSIGKTFAILTGGTYIGASLQNARLQFTNRDNLYAQHPVTGVLYAWDGFYAAAGLAAMEAAGPTYETSTGFALQGFTQLGNFPDKTADLQAADELTMAAAGFVVLQQPFGQGRITVKDNITTAPYTTNGSTVNAFYQTNVQAIDDAVAAAKVQAAQPLLGRPRGNVSEATGLMQSALVAGITALGDTINALNSVTVTIDPNTQAFTETTSYVTRLGNSQIVLQQGFTFS